MPNEKISPTPFLDLCLRKSHVTTSRSATRCCISATTSIAAAIDNFSDFLTGADVGAYDLAFVPGRTKPFTWESPTGPKVLPPGPGQWVKVALGVGQAVASFVAVIGAQQLAKIAGLAILAEVELALAVLRDIAIDIGRYDCCRCVTAKLLPQVPRNRKRVRCDGTVRWITIK